MKRALSAFTLLLAGCGCGQPQDAWFRVFVTDDEFEAYTDENGEVDDTDCIALCEAQGALQTIDACSWDIATHAQDLEVTDTAAPPSVMVVTCEGTQTMVCL